MRSNLAYLARKSLKQKKINQTWTADGKVFVKLTEGGGPKRLLDASQLPE
jgi:hypothetical protein